LDIVGVLQALGNSIRKAVVNSLARRPLRFSELMEASGLNPSFDTGQFQYHLGELMKRDIILKADNEYRLTQFGYRLSKLLDTMERECAFLLLGAECGGGIGADPEGAPHKQPFRIRPYADSDFEGVAVLLMNSYNDAWAEMFGPDHRMSLEGEWGARRAVATDMLVPDTHVLVLEHGAEGRLVGFISYAIRYGGVYFIEYEWVEREYKAYGYDDELFQRVEDEARGAGEDIFVRVHHREHRFIDYLIGRGYDTLNMLELAKYLQKLPENYSGKIIEIEGHKFKLR